MWHVMFIMLFILGLILLLFSVEYEKNMFWNLCAGFMSSIIWLMISLSQLEIEIPYTMYNVSSSSIESGSHVFTSPISPYLVYLFLSMFIVMQIYTWVKVWDYGRSDR